MSLIQVPELEGDVLATVEYSCGTMITFDQRELPGRSCCPICNAMATAVSLEMSVSDLQKFYMQQKEGK